MRVSLCVGKYAEEPYFVPGSETPVHCLEELCACLCENAFLLDESIMNDALIRFVGSACGVEELANELYPLAHKQGSLSAFAGLILEYVGLFDEATIRRVEGVLKQGAGLGNIEKKKKQIDYLVEKRKFAAAITAYDALLTLWDKQEKAQDALPAASVHAGIYHNKGVAYVGLMYYEAAAAAFLEAYRISGEREEMAALLATKRLELTEEEYIAYAAEHPQYYEESLALEKRMESLRFEWKLSPGAQRIEELKELRATDRTQYDAQVSELLLGMRTEYREMARRG